MPSPLPSPYFARGGRYVPNRESFGNMMVSEQLRSVLVVIAKSIGSTAANNTRRSSGNPASKLAQAYRVQRGPLVVLVDNGFPNPRISMRVVNRMRYAAANEFGRGGKRAGFQNATRDLRRAGEAHGDLRGGA